MATNDEKKFTYADYQQSDAVKKAQAALDQQRASKPGAYQSQWQTQLNDTMDKILNREKFSYDLNGDALYQQYKDKYIKQGQMAMMDTMGQAQAMTGGYGNSYAQGVGQQAYQAQLQNLNDVVPELYQLALDQYNREGQDLYDRYSLLGAQEEQDYGRYRDNVSDYNAELDRLYSQYNAERDFDYGTWSDGRDFAYGQHRDDIADQQWQAQFDEAKRQYDQQFALSAGKSSGGGGGRSGDAPTNNLWYATGTYDDDGNPIFRNSEEKTQAFGKGVNPYTGTMHPDGKNGTFSNGYQPNNIGGTKLKNSGMTTDVTGKSQTIWEANGKYWLWRGDQNRYVEVDISDMD